MILLHISSLDGRAVLWAERSRDEQSGERVSSNRKPSGARLKKFPYDAGEDGLKLLHQQWGDAVPPVTHTEKAIAWLPTVDGKAVASSPLISQPADSKDEAVIRPWRITIFELSMLGLVHLLCCSKENRRVARGVILGNDVLFWRTVMRFAGSLVARQHYLPGICEAGESFHAQWQPVFLGADKERFDLLSKAMPPVIHALTWGKLKKPPTTVRYRLLTDMIFGFVDYFVSSTFADERSTTPWLSPRKAPKHSRHSESFHSQWLDALRTPGSILRGDARVLAELKEQVAEWRRPIDRISRSRFRLCFRLNEHDSVCPSERGAVRCKSPGKGAPKDEWRVEYLLQHQDDPSLLLPVKQLWKGEDGAYSKNVGHEVREYLLSSLGQASALSRHVQESLKHTAPDGYILDTTGAHEFLTQQALVFEQAGFRVFLPAWWTRKGTKLRFTAHVKVKSPAMKVAGDLSIDTIVAFNWQVALGDEILTPEELERLARLKAPLVRLRGQWVELNAEEIRAAIEFWKEHPAESRTVKEILRMKLGAAAPLHGLDFSGVTATGWVDDMLRKLEGDSILEELQPPSKLSGILRPYQIRGYSWMAYLTQLGFGACLADDMGLGKTVQALALVQRDWANGNHNPVLIVCPTSVVNNWRKEASRFTPGLPVMVHHGASRSRGEAFKAKVKDNAIVISTYSLLNRDHEHLEKISWRGIVVDEAQNIKNAETKQARVARALTAEYRLALTGTPVENNVGDLWSMMEFLNPGFLGSQAEFKRKYFVPIHTGTDPDAAERLRTATGPFILRRLKTDKTIISDLPEKMEMKVFCTLTKEQASLYESVLKDLGERLKSSEGIERKGLILATLSKLKQVCNHPAHFLKDNSGIPGRSGKVARLSEMLEEIVEVGDKALVFSQFAEMGSILKKHLQETFGREMLFLHGGVPRKPSPTVPAVILVVGVNGTGKTTSIAKLAHRFSTRGARVLLAAGDTFRAAAIDQLQVWAKRIDVPVVAHAPGADPSAVVWDAMDAAAARGTDVVIVDTAGRLHTKSNLMDELAKIRRTIAKRLPEAQPEVAFVLDATTGQNGLAQARSFHESAGLTGIILTKLDSTSKGGIAFAIEQALGVPVLFVGVGERVDDLLDFDPNAFAQALFA